MTATKPAFRCLTSIALGLADGRTRHLRAGDFIPPSWAAINGHQTAQWLAHKTVVLVADPDPAALEQADLAAAPREETAASATTIEEAAGEVAPSKPSR